ncbi:MAG TPA: hypothetical protein VNX86_04705 [Rhizomicrobium sp.]|jgi:hypothetical protein|nr:hypothetical protein [Rhizomicrobium sp.]
MQVRNNVAWAGDRFSYLPGDIIELPEDVAHARVAIGRAAYANDSDARSKPRTIKFAEPHPKAVAQAEAEKARAARAARSPAGASAAAQQSAEVESLKKTIAGMQAQLKTLTEPKSPPPPAD